MDVSSIDKEPILKKSVGRISRLFQKKSKKNIPPSVSSMSFASEPSLRNIPSQQRAPSLSSTLNTDINTLDTRSKPTLPIHEQDYPDNHSQNSINESPTLCRSTSMKSMNMQQLIEQRRQELKELDILKSTVETESYHLNKQLQKMQEKNRQRERDMDLLKNNYELHLRAIRSSDDDLQTIKQKLVDLRQRIQRLSNDILPYAEADITTAKLSTLWVNLKEPIRQLGTPLPSHRIQMLTEKFLMDVLVQNLNTNMFPGLSCNIEFIQLQSWLNKHDTSAHFSTQLRQELTKIIAQNKNKEQDIREQWKKSVDRNWNHLYRGLQKAYPSFLTHHSSTMFHALTVNNRNSHGADNRNSHGADNRNSHGADNSNMDDSTNQNSIHRNSAQSNSSHHANSTKSVNSTKSDVNTESPSFVYSNDLLRLVEDTIHLGSVIRGQDVYITAVDVKEGQQSFDGSLMEDEDNQTEGTIAFCISPPFVVKTAHRYEPLLKGRVLCLPL